MALLEVQNVTVRFGGITAVNDASFAVDGGSITGLIGPNGAGKTTLFNVITGLQPPTTGRVRFKGKDLTKTPVDKRAKMGMARTFQRLEAFGSLTVRENVQVAREIHAGPRSWFRAAKDERIDELIDLVGLQRYVDQRADSVPTGVARLLEMARALAIEPQLLLLDEPSSGLDDAETEGFGHLLQRLAGEGRAVLMVEHDMDLVMGVCDLIHVLEFGSVIATGTPAEIRSNRRVQAAYLGFGDDADLPVPDAVAAEATTIVGHSAHSSHTGHSGQPGHPDHGHDEPERPRPGVIEFPGAEDATIEFPPVEVNR
jgi:branched-chain amino acid transport system ATP-binding protein